MEGERLATRLVEIKSRLLALEFPAGGGSLLYNHDLDLARVIIHVPPPPGSGDKRSCAGPDLSSAVWLGQRVGLDTFREPYAFIPWT